VGAVFDEVVGPDVVRTFGPQPEARPVRQPEPATLGLLLGDLQPIERSALDPSPQERPSADGRGAAPDPLHPLVVHDPACGRAQQFGNLAVAVAAILARELDDVGGELFLVVPAPRKLALRRAVLTERCAGTALGDLELVSDVLDAGTATRGAQ
jgi:hypothetical protein